MISFVDIEFFSNVKLRKYFIEKDKMLAVRAWVEQFNKINAFCRTSLVVSRNTKERQERISFWVEVLKELLNLNNFLSTNAIYLALDNLKTPPKMFNFTQAQM